MKTILYTSISGQMTGGGQQSLLLLLTHLDRNLFHPILVCPCEGDFSKQAQSLGVKSFFIPAPSPARFSLSTILKFVEVLTREQVDFIHTDHPRQTFYAGIAALIVRKPLLWHLRVGDAGNRFFERVLYALAYRIIAVSQAAAARFNRIEKKYNKVSIVYNLVDLKRFNPQTNGASLRKKFNIPDDTVLFCTMGQLLPRKGQDEFLYAAAELLKRTEIPLQFMVVGCGTDAYTTELKLLAHRLEISDMAIFTGFRTDIPQLMASLDVFVLATSYFEGLSRVVIEAMASGKPVITTDIGGNKETITNQVTGILVPPQNRALLIQAMLELAQSSDLRKRLGHEARLAAEKSFSLNAYMTRINKVYKEMA